MGRLGLGVSRGRGQWRFDMLTRAITNGGVEGDSDDADIEELVWCRETLDVFEVREGAYAGETPLDGVNRISILFYEGGKVGNIPQTPISSPTRRVPQARNLYHDRDHAPRRRSPRFQRQQVPRTVIPAS